MKEEVLETYVSKRRDRKATFIFLKKIMKRYGSPRIFVTDRLRSYRAAMKVIGNQEIQEVGRWKNNRCENSHLPFRRQKYAMTKFKSYKTIQKFTSIHSSIYNHFNLQRHLLNRHKLKLNRSVVLAD